MPDHVVLRAENFQGLLDALKARGYQILGPTVRDGAIVYDELGSISDLPIGWTDEQEGGKYRLKKRADQAFFGYAVGPHSWKKYLHPPVVRLWTASRTGKGFQIEEEKPTKRKMALIGVRACELHAIAIQDRVFLGGTVVDSHYQARRDGIFVLAINCGQAGNTCFCTSMNTGPKATLGFDLALTGDPGRRRALFRCGNWVNAGRRNIGCTRPETGGRERIGKSGRYPREDIERNGPEPGHDRDQRASLRKLRASKMGRSGGPLLDLRQLYDGLSHVLLFDV